MVFLNTLLGAFLIPLLQALIILAFPNSRTDDFFSKKCSRVLCYLSVWVHNSLHEPPQSVSRLLFSPHRPLSVRHHMMFSQLFHWVHHSQLYNFNLMAPALLNAFGPRPVEILFSLGALPFSKGMHYTFWRVLYMIWCWSLHIPHLWESCSSFSSIYYLAAH